jgi:hypothetical protein
MKRFYRFALQLYPADFRTRFAAEMLAAFDEAADTRGAFVQELAGLLAGISSEWIAKFSTDRSTRGRALPDLRMMRPPGVAREQWFGKA